MFNLDVLFGIVVFLAFVAMVIFAIIALIIRPIIRWRLLKINDTFIKRGRKNKDPFKPEYEENKYIHIKDIKNGYILYTDWEGESPKKWEFSCHWYTFFAFFCDITWSKCKIE